MLPTGMVPVTRETDIVENRPFAMTDFLDPN
jgi:hypothetical protein